MDTRELMILAQGISAQHGVNVVFSGQADDAWCKKNDGKYTISVPFSTDNMLVYGYLDHEVGHARFTDFSILPTVGMERQVANIFEDVYVEERMGNLFPGAERNLRKLRRHVFTPEHVKDALAKDKSAWNLAFLFALYHRRAMADRELEHSLDILNDMCEDAGLPVDEMLEIVERPTHSTAENNALALEYVKLLEKTDEQQKIADPGSDGLGDRPLDNQLDKEGSVTEQARCEMNNGNDANLNMVANQMTEAARLRQSGMTAQGAAVKPDQRIVSLLRMRIPQYLQSLRLRSGRLSTEGKLVGRKLTNAMLLDPYVFRARQVKHVQEIEVGILCDYSSSMMAWADKAGSSRSVADELNMAVASLLVMLDELPGVTSWACGFHGWGMSKLETRPFTPLIPDGSTPLDFALTGMLPEFTARPGVRRILFVTTDGEPDGGVSNVQKPLKLLTDYGIEVYAIGLTRSARYVQQCFPNAVLVDDIAQLANKLEVLLREALCD